MKLGELREERIMSNEVILLKEEINRLEQIAVELQNKVSFFENHPSLKNGIKGEKLVSKLTSGVISRNNAPHDIVTKNGIVIEVKFANLSSTDRKNSIKTKRWTWKNILGSSGNKKYDQLILIGSTDNRYSELYQDSESPYILFDIPYNKVKELTTGTEHGQRIIQLTSNPKTQRSMANKEIYKHYQTTIETLEDNYNI